MWDTQCPEKGRELRQKGWLPTLSLNMSKSFRLPGLGFLIEETEEMFFFVVVPTKNKKPTCENPILTALQKSSLLYQIVWV